jgi:hypothetical protein
MCSGSVETAVFVSGSMLQQLAFAASALEGLDANKLRKGGWTAWKLTKENVD